MLSGLEPEILQRNDPRWFSPRIFPYRSGSVLPLASVINIPHFIVEFVLSYLFRRKWTVGKNSNIFDIVSVGDKVAVGEIHLLWEQMLGIVLQSDLFE